MYSSKLELADETLKNCTFSKTVLMLLVILGHATASWGQGGWFIPPAFSSVLCRNVTAWLGGVHIYAFALISGYLFCYKMTGGGYPEYLQFLKTKAKRLLIPYLFGAIIWVVPITQFFYHYDLMTLVNKYVLCINPSQLWFLWMLFWVFGISWPLWRLLSDQGFKGLLTAGILFCVGVLGNMVLPNFFMIWTGFQYVVFFYLGIQIRLKHQNGQKVYIASVPWWLWTLLYTVLFVMVEYNSFPETLFFKCMNLGLSTLEHLVGAVMAFVVLDKFAGRVRWRNSVWFMSLVACSLGMYLFHQQIVYVTVWLFNGRLVPFIHAVLNFVVASLLSWGLTALLLKFPVSAFLIGSKFKKGKD